MALNPSAVIGLLSLLAILLLISAILTTIAYMQVKKADVKNPRSEQLLLGAMIVSWIGLLFAITALAGYLNYREKLFGLGPFSWIFLAITVIFVIITGCLAAAAAYYMRGIGPRNAYNMMIAVAVIDLVATVLAIGGVVFFLVASKKKPELPNPIVNTKAAKYKREAAIKSCRDIVEKITPDDIERCPSFAEAVNDCKKRIENENKKNS